MVSTQNKQMAQFFASVTERMSHGDFDLPSIRDIYETMHLAASGPEWVSYAEVDIDGVPALWCIPDVDTQGSTTGSGPSAAPTRDNPPPARWPSAPIPTPCCRWAAVARGDWAEAARPGGGPFRQPQGILAVVFGVRAKLVQDLPLHFARCLAVTSVNGSQVFPYALPSHRNPPSKALCWVTLSDGLTARVTFLNGLTAPH